MERLRLTDACAGQGTVIFVRLIAGHKQGALMQDKVMQDKVMDDKQPHRHSSDGAPSAPRGNLSLCTMAMPADTNQNGDIFGGWLLSQMDIAGGIHASKSAKARTVTVAINAMTFRKPVYVGDVVSVYTDTSRTGRTSITVSIEAWVQRRQESDLLLVTDGQFTYVAIGDDGRPYTVPSPSR